MEPYTITLTDQQMAQAAAVASRLHDHLRSKGVANAHGLAQDQDTQALEIGGAASELACALLLKLPWTASVQGSAYGPDIGTRTQVRSTCKARVHHSLIVRDRDLCKYGNVPFILVVQEGKTFSLLGWLMAQDATVKGKFWDGGLDRPGAWFVSQYKLRPMREFRD